MTKETCCKTAQLELLDYIEEGCHLSLEKGFTMVTHVQLLATLRELKKDIKKTKWGVRLKDD